MVKRATLASKIAGKKTRKRLYIRDLRGRFSVGEEKARHPGSFSSTTTKKKIRPNRKTLVVGKAGAGSTRLK